MQHEILTAGPLLDGAGRVVEPGFSRRPLLRYEPERIRLTPFRWLDRLRLKEWDFYAVTTRDLTFACAVAHGGLAGVVFAEWIDFRTRVRRERNLITPLGMGCALPRSSEAGDVAFARGGVEVGFRLREGRREVRIRWPRFDGERALEADFAASEPPAQESMVIATPIGARGFYYNRKTCGMPTTGTLAVGDERVDLGAAGGLTVLDWGRGVWAYRTFWIWATGAGRLADGRILGLNLGAGFGDTSAATENAIFVDGRMSKLGEVAFDYDRADANARPWRFGAADGRLDLTLAPDLWTKRQRLNGLVIASDLKQITGVFRGHVVTDAGERIELGDGVIGWVEEHTARW